MTPRPSGPLRVVFDSPIFSEQAHGGIARYFSELHREFVLRQDVESHVLAGLHANAYLDRSIAGTHGFRALRLPPRARRHAGHLNDAIATRFVSRLQPDVVHHTTFDQRRVKGAKSITTIHDLIHDLFPDHFALDPGYAERQAKAALSADGVICISESTRQDMERLYGKLKVPVIVSHLGVSGGLVEDEHLAKLISERMTTGRRPRLLFVGARDGYKGFDLLLGALSVLGREVHLRCVGNPFSETERAAISRADLAGITCTAGPASDQQLVELYRSSTCTVYPSAYEGFGLPVLESMAQGCPVVCGRHSSLIEVGGPAAHFFDSQDAESLAASIERVLLLDHDAYRSSAFSSLAHAATFNWKQTAERHLELYRSVLDR